ncbi:hypothetical protein CL617_00550 [archaeon]|nr:hypothetical protein [archaeon]|tara:strand:- start:1624 stop:1869 length:246 start_codon:yes stop_codon:yes gene_type:complete
MATKTTTKEPDRKKWFNVAGGDMRVIRMSMKYHHDLKKKIIVKHKINQETVHPGGGMKGKKYYYTLWLNEKEFKDKGWRHM